jgi:hypothetical protein
VAAAVVAAAVAVDGGGGGGCGGDNTTPSLPMASPPLLPPLLPLLLPPLLPPLLPCSLCNHTSRGHSSPERNAWRNVIGGREGSTTQHCASVPQAT